MVYNWFYIFNQAEFAALGLISKTYTVVLEGIGQKSILVTQGNLLGMVYGGVFLPANLNGKNPFKFANLESLQDEDGNNLAIQIDDNNDVWLGIGIDED